MGKQQTVIPPPLSNQQRTDYNNFLDFVDKSGYKGSTELDKRDTNLGNYLLSKYNTLNPHSSITYNDIPRAQQELQDYRSHLVEQYKSGKAQVDGIKSEDEIMPNLSQVDGWFGSKTSQHKFPVGTITSTSPQGTTVTKFGTNMEAYNKQMAQSKGTQ